MLPKPARAVTYPASCFNIGNRNCCVARFSHALTESLKTLKTLKTLQTLTTCAAAFEGSSTEAVALLCKLCDIGCGLTCETFPCRASLQLGAFAAELRCSFSPLPRAARAARLLRAPERRRRPCKLLLYRLSKLLRGTF